MIILSGVLVVLAIALLVTGIVTGNTGHELLGLDGLKLIYVSIGVSIVSALFLAVGVFLRRKELFGTAPAPAAKATGGRTSTRPVKAKARVGAGDDAPAIPATFPTATDVPAETTVYVVPGRKRYHLETCRQLAGRDKEELTFLEAREEGFTPCTACLPDTALAARAALTDTEPPARRPDDLAESPVEVTRTDIPAARPPAERPSIATRDDIREPGRTRELPAESPASGAESAETTAEPATAGTAVPEAAVPDEAIAEPPVERPRRRSMFEPLARSTAEPGTEPAAERAPSGGRDDDTAEPADTVSADGTETARDEGTDTGEAARRTHTVTGAESADEAADATGVATEDDATPGRTRVTETTADETAATASAPTAPADDRTGDETDPDDTADTAGEPETAEPAGAAGALAAPEREPATAGAAGADSPETADADDAETAGRHAVEEDEAAGDEAVADEAVADEADHTAAAHGDSDDGARGDSDLDDTAATDTDTAADTDTATAADAGDDTAVSATETEHAADDDTDDEAPAEARGPVVRVLSGTKRYHRPGCALIEGINDDADDLETLSRAEAKDRGCTPCLVCQPDDD